MHQLEKYRTTKWSVREEEAAFLFALTKMVAPKLVVEFGTLSGLTAVNFLNAMDSDAVLYSYDLSQRPEIAWIQDDRFHFLRKNQTDFVPKDIDFGSIDLVYIDASHNFALNVKTHEAIASSLSSKALIVTHDTAECAGRPDEVKFAEWLSKIYSRIDFHCDRKKRWGLSVFQKSTSIKML